MTESIELSTVLPVKAEILFNAWLDSKEHSAFTGGLAAIEPAIGGKYSAWDNYISGTTLELEQFKRIVQSWRSTDFPEDAPDSTIEVFLDDIQGETKLTIKHYGIPEGQGQSYYQGWKDFYFKPMMKYFTGI